MDKKLAAVYYDPSHPSAFGSIKSLYNAVKPSEPSLTYRYVKTWLQSQDVYTLHGRKRIRFKRRKTIAKGMNYQLQMDLVDLDSIKGYNFNTRYLLTVIDIFSRKAYVEPLRNKHHVAVLRALKRLFTYCPVPEYVQTDAGTEFTNVRVQDFFREKGIKHFVTSSDTKCSIVERFNRTLKNRMFKYFTANNTLSYLDILQDIVKGYNEKRHRSIGVAPNNVNSENEEEIFDFQYASYLKGYRSHEYKFAVGDVVRISQLHNQFRKGYLPTFTEEYFVIHSRLATSPPTYKLRDRSGEIIVGSFYEPEIQRVLPVKGGYTILARRKRKGKRENLVHFTGYPPEQKKWMSIRDMNRLPLTGDSNFPSLV